MKLSPLTRNQLASPLDTAAATQTSMVQRQAIVYAILHAVTTDGGANLMMLCPRVHRKAFQTFVLIT